MFVKMPARVEPRMKPSEALAAHRNEIREIVLAHRAVNARVFGSVVHGSDTDESDLDGGSDAGSWSSSYSTSFGLQSFQVLIKCMA